MILLLLTLSVFFSVTSQVLQKYVALATSSNSKSMLRMPLFWLAMACLGFSMLAWTGVLSLMDVGKAYPILSVNYVIMLFLAWYLFKEPIKPVRLFGVTMIVAGVIFMGMS